MKFVQPIPEAVRITLQEMHRKHPTFRCRQRAQAILLGARGFTLEALWSDAYNSYRDRYWPYWLGSAKNTR